MLKFSWPEWRTQSIDWYSFFLVHSLVTVERFNKFLWIGYLGAGSLPLPIYLFYEFCFNSNGSLAINNLVHFRNDVGTLLILLFLFLFLSVIAAYLSPSLIGRPLYFVESLLIHLCWIGYETEIIFFTVLLSDIV